MDDFMMTGAGNNSMASEYVKQELRATVGARMQQQGSPRNPQQHLGMTMQQQQQQQPDLSSLALNFEMPSSGMLFSINYHLRLHPLKPQLVSDKNLISNFSSLISRWQQ